MAISFVQVSNSSGVFTNPVAAGNSVVLIPLAFDFGNTTITSSAPLLGGSPVTGAADLLDVPSGFSTGSGVVYGGDWLLPNIPGGATTTGITLGGAGGTTLFALYGLEFSGLGSSPSIDVAPVSGASGNSANPAAGPTAATDTAPVLVVGFGIMLGVALTAPGAPWLPSGGLVGPSSFAYIGYQILTSAGGTPSWSQSSSGGTNAWSAGIVTIKGASVAAAATPAPLVVPQAAVMQAANW